MKYLRSIPHIGNISILFSGWIDPKRILYWLCCISSKNDTFSYLFTQNHNAGKVTIHKPMSFSLFFNITDFILYKIFIIFASFKPKR